MCRGICGRGALPEERHDQQCHHKKWSKTRAEKNPLVLGGKKNGFFTVGESLEVLGPRVQVGIKGEVVGCRVGVQEGRARGGSWFGELQLRVCSFCLFSEVICCL